MATSSAAAAGPSASTTTASSPAAAPAQAPNGHAPAETEDKAALAPSPSDDGSNGGGSKKFFIGGALILLLNFLFNEYANDSGLNVFTVTARMSAEARDNTTARSYFRAQVEHLGGSMRDASGTGAMRFELMEHRVAAGEDAAFTALLVHWQPAEEAVLPAFLQPHLPLVEAVQRYKTVFPARSGWGEALPLAESGELGEIGRVALLVQQTTLAVRASDADTFRRLWPDLGFPSLGEPGVVRCDLLEQVPAEGRAGAAQTATFVSRKVFRHAKALEAHEASEHAQRWREAAAPLLAGRDGDQAVTLLNTLHPRSSPHPFRSRWATVGASG